LWARRSWPSFQRCLLPSTSGRNIREGFHPHTRRRENLKSHNIDIFTAVITSNLIQWECYFCVLLCAVPDNAHLFPGWCSSFWRQNVGRILHHSEQSGQTPGRRVPVHRLQRRRRTRHSGHAAGGPLWVLPTYETY
jgi:hypothetical protein